MYQAAEIELEGVSSVSLVELSFTNGFCSCHVSDDEMAESRAKRCCLDDCDLMNFFSRLPKRARDLTASENQQRVVVAAVSCN